MAFATSSGGNRRSCAMGDHAGRPLLGAMRLDRWTGDILWCSPREKPETAAAVKAGGPTLLDLSYGLRVCQAGSPDR